MLITLNGQAQTFADNISVSQILKQLQVEEKIVAISLNGNIVKKGTWEETLLQENDKLELLQFMSGG